MALQISFSAPLSGALTPHTRVKCKGNTEEQTSSRHLCYILSWGDGEGLEGVVECI